MSPNRVFYVYAHYRKSDGRIFYIGKGKGERYTIKGGRNKYWKRIVKKHDRTVRKLQDNMLEPCSLSLEKALIFIHRKYLCNVTDGGEGVSGLKHTEEAKRKMVENRKPGWTPYWTGKQMPDDLKEKFRKAKLGKPQSPDHAAKSRIAKLGKPQPKAAREFTRKLKSKPIISSEGELFPSVAEAARILSKRINKNCSQGNISTCGRGERNNAYGLSWSYDISAVPEFKPTNFQEKSILCLETKEVFCSVQSAKKWVISWRGSANNQTISHAARNGGMSYGYHWKYL